MFHESKQTGRRYQGDIYCRKFGTTDGFIKMGNVADFATSQKVKVDTLTSTGKDDYGQAISVLTTPEPIEVKLKFNSFDKYALARALMGEAVDMSKEATTLTAVEFTASDGFIKLPHDNIDPIGFSVNKKSGNAVIDPEHYVLKANVGLIAFKPEAKVNVGDKLTYTGKTRAGGGYVINSNTLQNLDLELYLDGIERMTSKEGILTIPHVKLAADGSVDWFSDKWWEAGLSGTIVKEPNVPAMTFKEFG